MQETWVWSLAWEDPLEKKMVTYTSVLAWRIPRTEEPGRLQSMGLHESGMTYWLNHHHHVFINFHGHCGCHACIVHFHTVCVRLVQTCQREARLGFGFSACFPWFPCLLSLSAPFEVSVVRVLMEVFTDFTRVSVTLEKGIICIWIEDSHPKKESGFPGIV